MRVPPSYYGSTKAVPLFFKVKIYSGTDKLKTTLRQFELYISSKLENQQGKPFKKNEKEWGGAEERNASKIQHHSRRN